MKRIVILLVLAVGVVGIAALLLSMEGDGFGRERRAGGVAGSGSQDGEGSGEPGASKTGGGSDAAIAGADNDPNRIPGPDVTVRGIVLLDGVPVPNATVQLMRAQPDDPNLQLSWADPRHTTDMPAPIAEAEADANGRFTLTGARRTRIEVRAFGKRTGLGSARLVIPKEGDPSEVIVNVGPAFDIVGLVVNESGKPTGGVKLLCSSTTGQSYPFLQNAATEEDGRFGFANLGRGSHTLVIEKEGYPTLRRSFTVPEATELRIELVVGGAIEGTLRTDADSPVAGARILVGSGDHVRNAYGYAEATTDDAGAFRLPMVAPGAVTMATIEHADWGRRESSRQEVLLPRDLVRAGETLAWNIELANGVTVRGIIVEKGTEKPVPDAKLILMLSAASSRNYQPARHLTSDATGHFVAQHVLEGTYAVDVRSVGHMRAVSQWIQPNQKLVNDFFSDGVNNPELVRIEVGGSGRVEGHIRAEGVDNFTNAWVHIPELNNAVHTMADSTGFFVFENIPADETVKLKTWQPAAESELFTVAGGETKTVDMKVEGAPQFTGTVVSSNGDPVPGAYVKAAAANNAQNEFRNILSQGGWGSSRTDAEGKFSIRLHGWQIQQSASQKWLLAAVSYQYPLQVTTSMSAPKDGASIDVRIVLQPGGTIAGIVEFEGKGPLANAYVAVSPKSADQTAAQNETRLGRYAYTDLAGRFSIEGIGAGDWTVSTSHPDGKAEAQPASAGDADVRLTVKPTLALEGVVVDEDGKPLASVRIAAVVPNGAKEQMRWASTDASGRFRIAQLDAGDYELEVSPTQGQQGVMYYGGGEQNAGFKTTRTKAYPAGTDSIVVEVEPGAKISGRVLDPGGRPIGGAGIIAMPVASAKPANPGQPNQQVQNAPTAFTNGKGVFTIKGVEEGEYELVALASGYLVTSVNATVGESAVVINVKEGATIEGVLLAPDGTPLGGLWLNLQATDPAVQNKYQDWMRRGGNSWNNIGGWQATSGSTQSDGSFKMSGLTPGAYTVSVYTDRGVVPNAELHTGAGKVTIRLTEGQSISGSVLDEDGKVPVVTQGQGMIYISANANGQWKSAQADADGNFELKGLAAGTVKLQVWAGNSYLPTTVDAQSGETGVRITLKKRPETPPK